MFAGGNLSPGVLEDRGNRWVIAGFAVIGVLDGFCRPTQIVFWTIDTDTIRWLGIAVFAAGGVLSLWPVFVLGRRFSGLLAIQSGHTLVTTGFYRLIRHPSILATYKHTRRLKNDPPVAGPSSGPDSPPPFSGTPAGFANR